jgi:hypothetical protein
MTAYMDKEQKRWEAANGVFSWANEAASYLDALAKRLTFDDIDPGFVMPESFKHYEDTDNWLANRRPA